MTRTNVLRVVWIMVVAALLGGAYAIVVRNGPSGSMSTSSVPIH